MFTKLNHSFVKPLYVTTHGLNTFTGVNDKGIDYKKIWSPESDELYKLIPKKYWEDFYLTVMTINRNIPAHTDSDIFTTINFYLETDECETVFYEPIVDNLEKIQIQNQTNGFIYKEEQLKPVGSFVANPMDIWVLNVKKIHGVNTTKESVKRRAVTLHTKIHEYAVVCDMLKETGYL